MEDIIHVDYTHPKKVCKDFERKRFGDYHDFYAQSYTLLLVDVCVLKYMGLIMLIFFLDQDYHEN